jgi:hypothetical protein
MFAILYELGMFVADMFKSRRGVNPMLGDWSYAQV